METEFSLEELSSCWDEAKDLATRNHSETGALETKEFAPDKEKYFLIEQSGMMRVFTARRYGELIGYCVFIIGNHPHYPNRKFATQDLLFIDKPYRGITSVKFIKWIDEELAKMGMDAICRIISTVDYSSTLERMGYLPLEKSYIKKLNDSVGLLEGRTWS